MESLQHSFRGKLYFNALPSEWQTDHIEKNTILCTISNTESRNLPYLDDPNDDAEDEFEDEEEFGNQIKFLSKRIIGMKLEVKYLEPYLQSTQEMYARQAKMPCCELICVGHATEEHVPCHQSDCVMDLVGKNYKSTEELQVSGDVKADILICLMGDEVAKLGVWGMGGIGKTTIMKHVHNELSNIRKFKKVIWATVSYTFDIYKLQEQIADILNEKDELKKQDTIVHAGQLFEMLERHKPYLLILDDVWRSIELEDVGIPKPIVSDGCKLVLTTRSQEVARAMGCKIIKVKSLSEKEALKLFMDKVGDIVLSDEATLKGIVDECNGLPLAIVTVAGRLKGVSDPLLWSAALNQLKDCKRNVAGTDNNDDAFGVLKFSYDCLTSSKFQHCFLCCALYPENHNIPIDSVIDYWIDEELIDEMETVQAMKDDGLDILKKLEDNCLLESIKDIWGKDCVRMPNLVGDMAMRITKTSP